MPLGITAVLILSTVFLIKVLTVVIEPRASLACGIESTIIWNATVTRDPPDPTFIIGPPFVIHPSGKIANPEGSRVRRLESLPFRISCIVGICTGAYTTYDPVTSVQFSCSTTTSLCSEFSLCNKNIFTKR